MSRSGASAWMYLGLVFIGGVGVGGVADRLYTAKSVTANSPFRPAQPRTPQEYRQRYVEEMRSRLKLSPEQLQQLTSILDKTDARMRAIHERDRPEMTEIHREQVEKVHAILTAVQRSEYDKLRAERQRKRQAEEKSGSR